MATPKELIAQVAAQTGVPESTIIVHDRNLAEEGLRTPALRGRGISRVTFQDAANLLIAVAGSRNVKDSAKTVKQYFSLPTDKPLIFGDVERGKTFGDAVAALLEALPRDRRAFGGPKGDRVIVRMYGPEPSAIIEIRRASGEFNRRSYEPPLEIGQPLQTFADLRFIAQFSQVTLGHLGELVAG